MQVKEEKEKTTTNQRYRTKIKNEYENKPNTV